MTRHPPEHKLSGHPYREGDSHHRVAIKQMNVRYHQTMGPRRIPGKTALLGIFVLALSLVGVLTAYGWLVALNFVIPLITAALWILVVGLAAWGAGDLFLRWAMPTVDDTLERIFFGLIGGLGGLIVSTAALAVLHLLRPAFVLAVLGLWACLGALRLYRSRLTFTTPDRLGVHPFAIMFIAAGGLSLAASTTFAPFYDQWHYHLAFPYQWLRSGTIMVFDRNAYSFFPSNMGLLYVYALAGAGGWAAQIMHWLMGIVAAAGSALLAGRLGAPPTGRLLAAAIFLATPSVIQMGALAGSDLGVAAFAVAAALSLFVIDPGSPFSNRRNLIAGAFAGLAIGCKYLALATVAVPLLVVATALAFRASQPGHRMRASVVSALTVGLGMALVSGPWFVRNAIAVGNPTHPYFETIFDPSTTDNGVATGIGGFGLGPDKLEAALTLGTFARRGHSGDLGPAYLWLSPLVLIWAWRHRRRPEVMATVALIVAGTLFWAFGPPLGRYLLPTLTLLAACIAAAWTEISAEIGRIPRALFTGVLVAVLAANCNPIRAEYLPDQLTCFAGATSSDQYLEANCTQLEAIRAANTELPDEAVVLLVGEPRVYGLDRAFVAEDAFRTPLLVEIADASTSPAEMATRLGELGITHLLFNKTEARRIADTQGRDHYLECATGEADQRLRGFLGDFTRPVVAGSWWEIVTPRPASH